MNNWYLTDGMRWAIILAVLFFVFIGLITLTGGHFRAGSTDFNEARQMCQSKGVAHFGYTYHPETKQEMPDVTCNK